MSYEANPEQDQALAIIGIAGHFPGAASLDEFWKNLCESKESITFFSDQNLAAEGVDSAWLANPQYVKASPLLDGIEYFDAAFFGYSPREAEIMDPQQRLFLECAWEALENAGYDPERFRGRIGVYAGAGLNNYLLANMYQYGELFATIDHMQLTVANDKDYLATRVSYKLNLKGPSMSVQTACSTSLVAVHLACESLLNGECDMALAGGVSLNVPQRAGYWYHEGGIVSPDGHCRAFDEQALGTIFGSGLGIVVLKRLEDAIEDGDYIHAVLRGSAINNDGALKVGYTAPSVNGQAEVIAAAQVMAGVPPQSIQYIEAHGTGTPTGDLIELTALTKVFRAHTQKQGFCALGSVKSNIGHLDAASGMAGLIKTVLALKHQTIPPSLHCASPNPRIDWATSPFFVNTSLREWPRNGSPRRAGVSAFGVGGTNAHVIVEEAPAPLPASAARPWQLLLLSARSQAALETQTANLYSTLQSLPDSALADVAFTLQLGRRAFAYRRMLLVPSRQAALDALSPDARALLPTAHSAAQHPPVAFLFPGQGSLTPAATQELYQHIPAFRAALDDCCARLRPLLGRDLRALLFPPPEQATAAAEALQTTALQQPAIFVLSYALAKLWMEWGVQPSALLGHSLGEYVAATLAGVFELSDALKLVVARGQLMQACGAGAMLSVALAPDALSAWLEQQEQLELAAVNAPQRCVVSGPVAMLEELAQRLAAAGIETQVLATAQAFHSAQLEPMLEPFAEQVRQVRLNTPRLRVVSSVTGDWLRSEQATDPDYWVGQVRAPVQFAAGVATLLGEAGQVLLEVGPGQTLSRLVRQHGAAASASGVYASQPHARSEVAEEAHLLQTLGQLWLAGVAVDWAQVQGETRRQRLPLPTYPFERQRFWVAPASSSKPAEVTEHVPGAGPACSNCLYLPAWEQTLLPRPLESTAPNATSRWLVFTHGASLDNRLIDRLRRHDQQVFRILRDTHFDRRDSYTYAINPDRPGDYVTLLEELHAQGMPPNRIIYLWHSSLAVDLSGTDSGLLERQNTTGVVWLFQALAKSDVRTTPVQVIVLSNNLQDVTGAEHVAPEDVMMFGFCKVIAQELPSITCRAIDIQAPPADTAQEGRIVEQILTEINANANDLEVAYRGSRRWVPTFKPIEPQPDQPDVQLHQDGVYLISGSLYPAGRVLAEYLLQTVHAKVALLGQQSNQLSDTTPPDDAGWLDQLRQQHHARLLVLDVDTSDQVALATAIAQAEQQLGSLQGAIHVPRMTNNQALYRPIVAFQPTDLMHLSALMNELRALERALQGKSLDFCIVFSSTTAIVGGPACGVYAAGSRAIDMFAVQQSKTAHNPWCSINWDTWIDAGLQSQGARNGVELAMLTYQEALEVFQAAVSVTAAGRLVVSSAELNARLRRGLQWVGAATQRVSDQGVWHLAHPRPVLATPYVAPSSEVEQVITEIWQHLLGIEQIGVHDNFFELGGDSLLATQVISRIRTAFYVDIEHQDLLTAPTIGELARTIAAMPRDQEKMEILEMLAMLSDAEVDEEITRRMSLDEG